MNPVFVSTVTVTAPQPDRRRDRFRFILFLGFLASQWFQVPVFSLPVNWALWPTLPDLFAAGILLSYLLGPGSTKRAPFDRANARDIALMTAVYAANFLLVTVPAGCGLDGIRYGLHSVYVMTKSGVLYSLVSRVPLDGTRSRYVHRAAVLAFAGVSVTAIGTAWDAFDLGFFVAHLPRDSAGPWAGPALSSTAGRTHGVTATAALLLAALSLATAPRRVPKARLAILVTTLLVAFFTGSRQGVVRTLTFAAVDLARNARIGTLWLSLVALCCVSIFSEPIVSFLYESPASRAALERHATLATDPFSEEGLSGRPELWRRALARFAGSPKSLILGLGVGTSVEARSVAHNLFLQLLQDLGIPGALLVVWLWLRIFRRVISARREAWTSFALTVGMLTSVFTSTLFYPSLSEGGLLSLYLVVLRTTIGARQQRPASGSRASSARGSCFGELPERF